MTPEAVARSYVGTPFVHMGRSTRGLDCVGLIIAVARDLGIECWRDGSPTAADFVYPKHQAAPAILKICRAKLWEKPANELMPGDVVVLGRFGMPGHAGIVGECKDYLTLIHTMNAYRHQCIEHRMNEEWQKSMLAAFSLYELDPMPKYMGCCN